MEQPSLPALSAGEESEVRALVLEFAHTWNRHDMEAMHALDTKDVEWINVTGNHWQGVSAVFKGHDNIHRTIFAKTNMRILEIQVRPIALGVAIAVATMTFGPTITPTGEVLAEQKTRGSFTTVNRRGTWKIVHFHNTNVDLIAEAHDPITWDKTGWRPGDGE